MPKPLAIVRSLIFTAPEKITTGVSVLPPLSVPPWPLIETVLPVPALMKAPVPGVTVSPELKSTV
ncbi:MAG: hypothetical protein HYV96_11920 [Opitutae bacterium]|nr:hypothetical protein [Opitutae bacterium]